MDRRDLQIPTVSQSVPVGKIKLPISIRLKNPHFVNMNMKIPGVCMVFFSSFSAGLF